MKTYSLLQLLDETIGDRRIIEDLLRVLGSSRVNDHSLIEIDGASIRVPLNVGFTVVTKAVFKDRYNSGFGALRAQVAIGEVTDHEDGEVIAKYCFATLYYDQNCNLLSSDFHAKFR